MFLSSYHVVILLPFFRSFHPKPFINRNYQIQLPGKIEHYVRKLSCSSIPAIVPWKIHFAISIFWLCYYHSSKMITALQVPLLNKNSLKHYVDAEYSCMIREIKSLIQIKVEQSNGNNFGQLIHNGFAVDNGDKVQLNGLQFVHPKFQMNHFLCSCCYICTSGKGNCVAQFIRKITMEVASQDLNDVCDIYNQDHSALSVVEDLGIS